MEFFRAQKTELERRLREHRRFINVVAGPRQVGKTTLVRQVLNAYQERSVFATADEPALKGTVWIEQQWEAARVRGGEGATEILALDEIQKIHGWAETVKRLWDEDTHTGAKLKVIILGSAPLLVERGLGESLAGRFETLHVPHWSYAEMSKAFEMSLEDFIFFGGYPGAAGLVNEPARWAQYIKDSLIETTISRDVLLLSRVDKPALLRRLFDLACTHSGQILSYTKMIGQLTDAGNTTTLAHYLDLLSGAGMVTGLQKFSASSVRRRGSIPKLQVLNTALMSAQLGYTPTQARGDRERYGRLVELAVGAHLANAAACGSCELFYWRERNSEVDFVVRAGQNLIAIEVKSGRSRDFPSGLAAFKEAHRTARLLLVGGDGIPLEEFLTQPVERWLD